MVVQFSVVVSVIFAAVFLLFIGSPAPPQLGPGRPWVFGGLSVLSGFAGMGGGGRGSATSTA